MEEEGKEHHMWWPLEMNPKNTCVMVASGVGQWVLVLLLDGSR